jgi:hypothetical protein
MANSGMRSAVDGVAGYRHYVAINLDMKFISAGILNDNPKGAVKILKN